MDMKTLESHVLRKRACVVRRGAGGKGLLTQYLACGLPDYVVVLCQYSKAEAQQLKEAMATWLKEHLGLTQHPEKTHITHWSKRFRFLGYDLRGQRNRNGSRWLRLSIPPEKERELKAKVKRLCAYDQIPELDLFTSVNALLNGWTNYYRYANNATNRFLYLTGVAYWLTAHAPLAQASLFHQESDAHPLWKRSQKRQESIVHDQRHRKAPVSLEQAPEMAVAVEPNSPGKRCATSAHHELGRRPQL